MPWVSQQHGRTSAHWPVFSEALGHISSPGLTLAADFLILWPVSVAGLSHSLTPPPPCPDSNSEEALPASVKNKYEAMDFDSLLKEAQQSLH